MNDYVKEKVEDRIVTILEPYIKEKKIVGSYLVPYALGPIKKIDLTIVTKEPGDLDLEIIEEEKVQIVKTSHDWNQFGERSEERHHSYRRLVKDLRDGQIIYDPQGILRQRKKALEIKEFLGDYQNLWDFPNEIGDKIIMFEEVKEQQEEPKKK